MIAAEAMSLRHSSTYATIFIAFLIFSADNTLVKVHFQCCRVPPIYEFLHAQTKLRHYTVEVVQNCY